MPYTMRRLRSKAGKLAKLIRPPSIPTPPASKATVVSLADKGGVGDGTTNDFNALQAAVDAVTAAGGGVVLVPDKAYLIKTGAGTGSGIYLPADVTIRGAGPNSELLLASNDGNSTYRWLFRIGGDRVHLENVKLTRSGRVYGVMLDIRASKNVWLYKVTMDGHLDEGTDTFEGIKLWADSPDVISGLRIVGCTIRRVGMGLVQDSARTGTVTDVLVQGCTFRQQYATDLEFNAPSSTMTALRILNNLFLDNNASGPTAGWGVGLANCQDVIISGCGFSGYQMNPIHIEDRSAQVIISNNRFVKVSTKETGYESFVFIISASNYITVTGNVFDTSQQTNGVDVIYAGPGGSGYGRPHHIVVTANQFYLLNGSVMLANYGADTVTATPNSSSSSAPAAATVAYAGGATGAPAVTTVTANAPTFTDNANGTGSVKLPAAQAGVVWTVGGVTQVGGASVDVSGQASVAASAASGYALSGQTSWTFTPTSTAAPTDGLPFKLDTAALRQSSKKAFVHYFGSYPKSIDNAAVNTTNRAASDYYDRNYLSPYGESNAHYASGALLRDRPLPTPPKSPSSTYRVQNAKLEIGYMQAAGVDGAFCNIMGLSGESSWNKYVQLRDAAVEWNGTAGNPTFYVVPMLDGRAAGVQAGTAQSNIDAVCDAVQAFAGVSSTFILPNGKMLLGVYMPDGNGNNRTETYWQGVKDTLAGRGIPVAIALCPNSYLPTGANFTNITDIGSTWGFGGDPGTINAAGSHASTAKSRGQQWMGPINAQNVRTESWYDEAIGSRALAASWDRAITDGADFVQYVTWSDYWEGGHFAPSAQRGFVPLDLAAWGAARWKLGTTPAILRDAIYVSHRNQILSSVTPQFAASQVMYQNQRTNRSPAQDVVEVRTFLTAQADVTVTVGGTPTTYTAPAGEYSQTVPAALGSVSVVAKRSGTTVSSVTSPIAIVQSPPQQDPGYYQFSSLRPTDTYFVPTWLPDMAPQATADGQTVTVTWTAMPNATGYTVQLDDGAAVSASSGYQISGVYGGTHTVKVTAQPTGHKQTTTVAVTGSPPPAAWSVVAADGAPSTDTASATTTVTLPTVQAGDVLILAAGYAGGSTTATCDLTGATAHGRATASGISGYLWSKVLTAADSGKTVKVTLSSASFRCVVRYLIMRGPSSVGSATSWADAASGGTLTLPALTPTSSQMVVQVPFAAGPTAGNVFTAPANMTIQTQVSTGATANASASVAIGTAPQGVTPGASWTQTKSQARAGWSLLVQ